MGRKILILSLLVLGIFSTIFWLKLLSPEDDWRCEKNEWVKHGSPSTPKPIFGCGKIANELTTSTAQSPEAPTTTSTVSDIIVPKIATLTGLYVCLPAQGDGPQTMECALGFLADRDQSYYALDTNSLKNYIIYPTGTRLKITGSVYPIEMISSNVWKKYNIKGIIKLNQVEEID